MPNPTWHEQIDKSLQGHEALVGYETVGDFAKAHIESSNALKGEVDTLKGEVNSRLKIPGEGATDEERTSFFTKLGRPEKPENYSFKLPEDFPKDIPWDEKEFRQWAFEEGLSDKQATNMLTRYTTRLRSQIDDFRKKGKETLDGAVETLRKEWGGDYDKNVELANRAVAKLFGEEGAKQYKDLGLDTEPLVARLAHAYGALIGEDHLPPTGHKEGEASERKTMKKMFPSMEKKG